MYELVGITTELLPWVMLDFTLKLLCDQTEVSVHTDDLETLQGLLRELRRSHLIARKDMGNNFDIEVPERHDQ